MNPQSDFMSEAFHTLAQPITALRATIELGLREDANKPGRQVLEDCLRLSDRLMQEMAVLREIANFGEAPQLELCDGLELLQGLVEEMIPVAEANGVALLLEAQQAVILCHPPTFQRALFVLLNETIASAGRNREISISFDRCEGGFCFAMHPVSLQGQRQTLCRKLMQLAGGSVVPSDSGNLSVIFREGFDRQIQARTLADEQLLTSHQSLSRNGRVESI